MTQVQFQLDFEERHDLPRFDEGRSQETVNEELAGHRCTPAGAADSMHTLVTWVLKVTKVDFMFRKRLSMCIVVMSVAVSMAACKKDEGAPAPQAAEAGGKRPAKSKTDGWPEPTPPPPIEFTAVDRPTPKTVEDAVATLESIRKLYDSTNVPDPLNGPLTIEDAYEVAKAIKLMQSQLPLDVAWIQKTKGSEIPGADKWSAQSFDNPKASVLSRLEQYLPKEIEYTLKYSREHFDGTYNMHMPFIEKAADVDMSDQNAVRNLLGKELLNHSRDDTIKMVGTAIEAAILFDMTLDGKTEWTTKRDHFREVVTRYREKLATMASAITPPADVGDAALTAIAREVLSRDQYGLPEPARIIVNTRKKSASEDKYTVDFGERTITRDPYRWEEFQVATIEKQGDSYYLWYNTLLNYSVGPQTVPTGKWVLGPRHKSSPIAEANINK